MILYQFPVSAAVNRAIPKNKLYQQGNANNKLKQFFVDEVGQIIWAYKLSSSTLNIQTNADIQEIQIFRIISRLGEVNLSIIKYIDKLIPTPIIFEVVHGDKVKVIATYKRASQSDRSKVVTDQYYESEWLIDSQRQPLPVVLNLSDLYNHLIEQLLPKFDGLETANTKEALRATEVDDSLDTVLGMGLPKSTPSQPAAVEVNIDITAKLKKVQQAQALAKQIEQLQTKIKREKQPNRQILLNVELNKLKQQLKDLKKEL